MSPSASPQLAHPSALFNSQVTPFAVLTGPYAYVAAGAALRDQGYGRINLTWPGAPSTSNLVAAYMIWSILDDGVPASNGTLNGVDVVGTWTAYATPSPCWSPTFIYTFAADVTSLVLNGNNALTGFPSGLTDGLSPWSDLQITPMDEGVSLVAVYDTGAAVDHEVTVFTGAQTSSGGTLTAQLNYSTTNSTTATTTYIMADGQLPSNAALWNGTDIDPNAFPGSDPHESSAAWAYGNLSDTKTYTVPVVNGSTTVSAGMSPSGDCLTWVGQVLSVGVAASPPPYTVTFYEQGLDNGTAWNVTTNATKLSGTVTDLQSAIVFSLGNGSYTYAVGPIPGYTAQYHGSFKVAGGDWFIRVLFHPVLYPVSYNETGLPTSSYWWATTTNVTRAIDQNVTAYSPSSIELNVSNGTYNFSVGESGLYRAIPSNGSFTVNGTGVTVNVTFVPPPLYNVTFVETGLPIDTVWSGQVISNFGDYSFSTNNSSYLIPLPNTTGVDQLLPGPVTGFGTPGTQLFQVHGAPVTVYANYSRLYLVYLNETGLPSGTYWTAYLSGSMGSLFRSTSGVNVSWAVPNGSYTFSVPTPWGYDPVPSSGYANVSGADVAISVTFVVQPTYALNFTESGLPAGTNWTITVDLPVGPAVVINTTSPWHALSLPNGSYYYLVTAVPGFQASPSTAYASIDGSSVNVTITFARIFSVVFTESGLPSDTYWYVELGGVYGESYGTTITFEETNGSYPFYTYTIDGYTANTTGGTVNITGAGQSRVIVYSSVTSPTFTVTFTETGLPAGSNWSVELNYYVLHSVGTSLTFTETNGSYAFEVFAVGAYLPTPSGGTVDVSGAPASQPVVFAIPPPEYDVTFNETGLSGEAIWWVTFGGDEQSAYSSFIIFSEPNGTYPFNSSAPGYTATPTYGSVTVSGHDVNVSIVFSSGTTPTFLVTFTATGLPSETEWWVNVTDGPSLSGSGPTLTVSLANGSYTYVAVASNHSYTAPGGSFHVSGAAVGVTVHFGTNSGGGSDSFLGLTGSDAVLVGILGAVAVLGLILALLVGRRRKKKDQSPPPPPPAGAQGATGPSPPSNP